jgi:hypothetical protein
MPNPDGSATAAELTVARSRMLEAEGATQFTKLTHELKALGDREYGADDFGRASRVVAEKFGQQFDEFTVQVMERDNAHRLIHHLAANERELEQVKALPAHRRPTALANIESRWSGHGHLSTASQPAWRQRAGHAYLSEQDFHSPASDALTEAEWQRNYERRRKARVERKGGWR